MGVPGMPKQQLRLSAKQELAVQRALRFVEAPWSLCGKSSQARVVQVLTNSAWRSLRRAESYMTTTNKTEPAHDIYLAAKNLISATEYAAAVNRLGWQIDTFDDRAAAVATWLEEKI